MKIERALRTESWHKVVARISHGDWRLFMGLFRLSTKMLCCFRIPRCKVYPS